MPLGPILLVAFITVPIVEVALFITVGGWIGLVPTILVILATAIIGAAMIRAQGTRVLSQARQEMEAGRPPIRELFDGLCLFVAGALLLTPGFFTDLIGFLLLVPVVRAGLLRAGLQRVVMRQRGRPGGGGRANVIDAEFTVVPEHDRPERDRD